MPNLSKGGVPNSRSSARKTGPPRIPPNPMCSERKSETKTKLLQKIQWMECNFLECNFLTPSVVKNCKPNSSWAVDRFSGFRFKHNCKILGMLGCKELIVASSNEQMKSSFTGFVISITLCIFLPWQRQIPMDIEYPSTDR